MCRRRSRCAPEAAAGSIGTPAGRIEVRAEARSEPHELTLAIEVAPATPVRFLISHHVALNGDDGSAPGPRGGDRDGGAVIVAPAPGSDVASRFPNGSFDIAPLAGTPFERVGGDEVLFADGRSRRTAISCASSPRPARRPDCASADSASSRRSADAAARRSRAGLAPHC